MQTLDYDIFLALNFDGGSVFDRIMLLISGTAMWLPLYVLILWLVWRRTGWCGMLIFLVLMGVALGLADMIAGIFKHAGLLKDLLPDFDARPRPMFASALEGLNIPPDSLRTLRQATPTNDWIVHVPKPTGGLYGTVSSHAATIVTLAVFSCKAIRRRWFSVLMIVCTVVICYSRIYLAKHFPLDILWGALLGLALGFAAFWGYRKFLVILHVQKRNHEHRT